MDEFIPAEVFPPGDYLREELEFRGWTQADFADIIGRPVRLVNEIIRAKRRITPETAKDISAALGTPAQFWLNLQMAYDLSRVREDTRENIARRAALYAKAPISQMIRRRWIEPSPSTGVLETNVLEFFGIESLDDEIVNPFDPVEQAAPDQVAWLRRAQQLAPQVEVKAYTESRLPELLEKIKGMLESPEDSVRLPRLLADYGIRLVIVEPLPNSKIDSACLWLDDESPVIALAFRHDRIDHFWYAVAHELGHVNNRDSALDTDLLDLTGRTAGPKPDVDRIADDFAEDLLVPPDKLETFTERISRVRSARGIRTFASQVGVHPGIVVGQLEHRGAIGIAQHRKLLTAVRDIVTAAALTDGWGYEQPVAI